MSPMMYYLEGRKGLFLILLIRPLDIKMTLLTIDGMFLWKNIKFMS